MIAADLRKYPNAIAIHTKQIVDSSKAIPPAQRNQASQDICACKSREIKQPFEMGPYAVGPNKYAVTELTDDVLDAVGSDPADRPVVIGCKNSALARQLGLQTSYEDKKSRFTIQSEDVALFRRSENAHYALMDTPRLFNSVLTPTGSTEAEICNQVKAAVELGNGPVTLYISPPDAYEAFTSQQKLEFQQLYNKVLNRVEFAGKIKEAVFTGSNLAQEVAEFEHNLEQISNQYNAWVGTLSHSNPPTPDQITKYRELFTQLRQEFEALKARGCYQTPAAAQPIDQLIYQLRTSIGGVARTAPRANVRSPPIHPLVHAAALT
jgi:hypothetical protein